MKICAAQIRPLAGEVEANIEKHIRLVELAVSAGAGLIIFPELSVTGYEPTMAKGLAFEGNDQRLKPFQALADSAGITIGIGLPVLVQQRLHIGMFWYSQNSEVEFYGKQHLHKDEAPFFDEWDRQLFLEIGGHKLTPAICYESMLPQHAIVAAAGDADVYLCSVAKDARGVEKGMGYYPKVAQQHRFALVLANSVGPCDSFVSAGNSAVWNHEGRQLVKMDGESEGIVVFDSSTDTASVQVVVD